jgi:PAS domain S-box-containing protein
LNTSNFESDSQIIPSALCSVDEFNKIIKYLPQGIRIINTDYIVKYINPSFSRLSGVKLEDAIGKKCYEVFPSPFCHTPQCRLIKMLTAAQSIQTEIYRTNQNGDVIPCTVSAFPIYNENKNLIGIMESFRDITDEKILKEKVEESEKIYKTTFESTGTAMSVVEENGVILAVNKEWEKFQGYSKEEIRGMRYTDFLTEQGLRADQKYLDKNKIGEKKEPLSCEMSVRDKQGNIKHMLLFVNRIPGTTRLVSSAIDITKLKNTEKELRNSEQKLRLMFETLPEGFIAIDGKGVVTEVNEALVRIYGYNHKNELIGLKFSDLLYKTSIKKAALIKQKLVNEGSTGVIELTKLKKDGSTFPAEISGSTLRDSSGKTIGYIAIIKDITERKQAEKKLRHYQNHLEKMVKERTVALEQSHEQLKKQMNQKIEFMRGIVHEIRTPLTPLFSTSDYLVKNLKVEPWLTAAKNIHRGADRLNQRIEDLFDLTRTETGNLTLHLAEENLVEILEEVVSNVLPMISSKSQGLSVDVPDTLPSIIIDKERIYQTVFNLIENAVKFTPEEGKICLKAREKKGKLVITVKNEGSAIALDDQRRLFQPYYRSEENRSSNSGLGLGLALAKAFVELHNGKIWVTRQPPGENVFSFSLPLYNVKSVK